MTATYTAAATLADALAAVGSGSRPIAGGTDLVVGARQGKAALPESLVAIHGLAELRGIAEEGGGLRIGALASHAELVAHPAVRERFTALADASAIVGSHATRHVGTIGGNVMNASPAMETGGPLLCFGAEAVLASAGGERRVGLDGLLKGPGRTDARADELLVRIDVPAPGCVDERGPFQATQFYRPDAVYGITPTTADVAIRLALANAPQPVQRWELPPVKEAGAREHPTSACHPASEAEVDDDEDDDSNHEFGIDF